LDFFWLTAARGPSKLPPDMAQQKKVNLDARIGKLLATYSDRRGVRQQHALNAATLFYLCAGDQIRGTIDYAFSRWAEGKELAFVTEDWVACDTTTPWLKGEDAASYIHLMSAIAARAVSSRQFAKEACEFLEGGKKPPWLFDLDPDRDSIAQLIERGVISEVRTKRADTTKPTAPKRPKRKKR